MAPQEAVEHRFKEQVKAADRLFIAGLYDVEEAWSKRPNAFHRVGMSADGLCLAIEKGFRRYLWVAKRFPTEIGSNPVKWAEGRTASILKKRLKVYSDGVVPFPELLRFVDVLAAQQTLREPLSEERGSSLVHRPDPVACGETRPAAAPKAKASANNAAFRPSEDYTSIQCPEKHYSLTETAGAIVKVLHEASMEGRSLSTKEIRNKAKCGRVWDAFRRRDGKEFWKAHIKKTDQKMFYLRLDATEDLTTEANQF